MRGIWWIVLGMILLAALAMAEDAPPPHGRGMP